MRPTRRGLVVGSVAVLLLVLGFVLGYPTLRAVAGCALAALAVAFVPALTGLRPRISRAVTPDRVERGRPAVAELEVANPTHRRQAAFVAHDVVGTRHHEVAVRSLPAGGTARFYYDLPTDRRGLVPVGPVTVERADLFGLARARRTVGQASTLRVYPRRHPVRLAAAGRPRHHHEGEAFATPMRGSMDLRGLRPYVIGDEVRHLHWKATARTGELMVREYVDPAQPWCVVLLDTRHSALDPDRFEEAVEIAASIVRENCEQDRPARLCTTDGVSLTVSGGAHGTREVLDRLCDLSQHDGPAQLPGVTARRGEGWLVLVGGAELPEAVALSRRFADTVAFDLAAPEAGVGHDGVLTIRATDAASGLAAWNSVVAR